MSPTVVYVFPSSVYLSLSDETNTAFPWPKMNLTGVLSTLAMESCGSLSILCRIESSLPY